MDQTKQHWVTYLKGERPDKYVVQEKVLEIQDRKFLWIRNNTVSIPFNRIDDIQISTTFWGWLLKYKTLIINAGNNQYILTRVVKANEFKQFIINTKLK